jgi:hypothetical protein
MPSPEPPRSGTCTNTSSPDTFPASSRAEFPADPDPVDDPQDGADKRPRQTGG